jgi:sec-independent protein translocase protein TatC
LSPYGGQPIFTAPTDMLGATVHLAIKGGAVVAAPVLMVGLYTLVRPWLSPTQRRFLTIFLPSVVLCFATGAAFAYFVMIPVGLRFLLHFGDGVAVPLITLTQYLSLLMALMFWLGVVFQIPLAMFLLVKMRVRSYKQMRGFRKYVPVTAFFLAAIITPTFDVVNQTLVAVPIIILYEGGLILARIARPKVPRPVMTEVRV